MTDKPDDSTGSSPCYGAKNQPPSPTPGEKYVADRVANSPKTAGQQIEADRAAGKAPQPRLPDGFTRTVRQ
jgi:hypothetical protein